MPEEAIERLAEVLELPGPQRVSPLWGNPAGGAGGEDNVDGAEDEPADAPESPFITLPPVQRGTRDEVMELATEMARDKWGITPTTEFFPADVAATEEWAEMLNEALKIVRERHRRSDD